MLNVDIGGAKGNNSSPVKHLWKILDIRPCDYVYDLNSGKPFPFKNSEVDNYYTSMTLESVWMDKIQFVFKEIYRTLKPGGIIRVIVPDVAFAMKLYLNEPQRLFDKSLPIGCVGHPDIAMTRFLAWFVTPDKPEIIGHSGHKMAFDKESLTYYFCEAGFDLVKIKWLKYNECSQVFKGRDKPRWLSLGIYMEVEK